MVNKRKGGVMMQYHAITQSLENKFKKIKLIAFDFDGVFTDGHVYFREDGKETVRCSRKDSLGVNMLKKAGIGVCVISKEPNPVVTARCNKMGIQCFQKAEDGEGKRGILERIMKEKGVSKKEAAFMGDDVNDIAPMNYAGIALTVADAHPAVKDVAHYITECLGGEHAVREICEILLRSKGISIEY